MSETRISIADQTVEVSVEDSRVDLMVVEQPTIITTSETGTQGPRGTQVLSGIDDPDISLGLIGDQYLNTSTGELFGPKTVSGWGTGVSISNPNSSTLGQVYTQNSPATVWDIVHTLIFVPNIIVVDTAGTVIEGDYEYMSNVWIRATFNPATAGKAYLS